MKSRTLTCITAITLFAALAIPVQLVAQEQQEQAPIFTVFHAFTAFLGARFPTAGLVRDSAGNLYGTTPFGGALACGGGNGCGVVFKLDTTGKDTGLQRFTVGADGSSHSAGVVRDAAGNLYGTTYAGGRNLYGTTPLGGDLACSGGVGCGVVFKLDTTGKETVLHSFTLGG